MKHCAKCRGTFPDDLDFCPVCTIWPKPSVQRGGRLQRLDLDAAYPSVVDVQMAMDRAHGKDWKDI